MRRDEWLMAWALERAAAKKRWASTGVPWLVGIAISGNGDFEPRNEERFDFPCSAIWRDFYEQAPEARQYEEPTVVNSEERRRKAYEAMKKYDVPMPNVIKKHKPVKHEGTVEV